MPKSDTAARLLKLGAVLAIAAALAAVVIYFEVGFLAGRYDRQPGVASAESAQPPTSDALKLSFAAEPKALPYLQFADGEGHPLTLTDFRGRAVLLNIWATWCVPCRKEMPTLDRLQAKLGSPQFQVLALSIDRKGVSVIKPFYKELGLKALGIYVDQSGEAAGKLKAPGIPLTLLVDKQGREIARKLGPEDWDKPEMIGLIRHHLWLAADDRSASR